jgi:putative transposase
MPRNVHPEINLHMNWRTKNDVAVLVDQIESRCHRFLMHRCLETRGVCVHAVGGTETHVHLAVSIPPTVKISEWIGQLKGASSHHINHDICNRAVLEGQVGYGVVSFGTKDLAWVIQYVRNRKRHHADGAVFDRLERTEQPEDERPEGPCEEEGR